MRFLQEPQLVKYDSDIAFCEFKIELRVVSLIIHRGLICTVFSNYARDNTSDFSSHEGSEAAQQRRKVDQRVQNNAVAVTEN